jgi:hypothetical protein
LAAGSPAIDIVIHYQKGRIIVYLILGVGVRVILLSLLTPGAVCHAAKALGRETQAVDVVA